MLRPDAPVAQLDRAPGFEPVGRGFKSLRARHITRIDSRQAPVAQLDRALASEAKGRRFEFCRAHHLSSIKHRDGSLPRQSVHRLIAPGSRSAFLDLVVGLRLSLQPAS